jgi:O-antigen/teichoic acid export membrane protein
MLIGGVNLTLRVISMVSTIVLARLLSVNDFGIVGLAMIVTGTANLISGLGMPAAVIHSQEDRRSVAYHAFVITVLSGLVLLAVIYFNAEALASLLNDQDVIPVLRWLAFLLPLGTLSMIPEALLNKDQHFARVGLPGLFSELAYIGSSVGFAYAGFGLWSIVYATLLRSLISVAMIWVLCPGWDWVIPRPWNWGLVRRLLGYGTLTSVGGVVSFLYSITDNLIVGRYLGKTALGYYGQAYNFTIRTVFTVSGAVSGVLFTSFAKIQHEHERLSQGYLRTLRALAFFTVPLSMGIFATAADMVPPLLGAKWVPAIPSLQVLAFVGLIMPLSASTSALFSATAHPGYNVRAGLVVLGVMLPAIFAFLPWGIVGVALAVLCAHVAGFAYNVYQVSLVLKNTALKMLLAIAPAIFGSLVMVIAVYGVKFPLLAMSGGTHNVFTLAIMVLVGAASYAAVLYAIQKQLVVEIVTMFLEQVGKKRGGHAS